MTDSRIWVVINRGRFWMQESGPFTNTGDANKALAEARKRYRGKCYRLELGVFDYQQGIKLLS